MYNDASVSYKLYRVIALGLFMHLYLCDAFILSLSECNQAAAIVCFSSRGPDDVRTTGSTMAKIER